MKANISKGWNQTALQQNPRKLHPEHLEEYRLYPVELLARGLESRLTLDYRRSTI